MYDIFNLTDYLFGKNTTTTLPFLKKKNIKNENGKLDDGSTWTRDSYMSDDGTYYISYYTRNMPADKKLKDSSSIEEKIVNIKNELRNAIEAEDWDTAAKFRDKLKDLEKNYEKIKNLLEAKRKAIDNMEFEEVKKIVSEIKKYE